MAPEVARVQKTQEGYGPACDIWSVGITGAI